MSDNTRQREWQITAVFLIGASVLLAILAWPLLTWWFWEYTRPDSYYGYALFVPLLVGAMVWSKRDLLRTTALTPCYPALFLLVPALALLVVATKIGMEAVMSAAFLFSVIGAVWFIVGTPYVKRLWFALAFLFLMAPLPGPVLNDATLGLQRLSTSGAAKLLALLSFQNHQQGNMLYLENFSMLVEVACSGFKLLLCLLTFSAAFAYLSDMNPTRKFALFSASLPLSLVLNSLRIAMVGIVGECVGASAAHAFHDWSGIIMLVLCMILLFGLAKVLGCRKIAGLPLF